MSQVKSMIKKCDTLFSECIRLRDKNKECITCNKPFRGIWGFITCGHFQKRTRLSTRWNFDNAYGQCYECNGKDDQALFTRKLIDLIGEEKVAEIIKLSRAEVHLSYSDLKEIYKALNEYKQKIKQ